MLGKTDRSFHANTMQWPLDHSTNTETITLDGKETKYLNSAIGTVSCSKLRSFLKGCLILPDKSDSTEREFALNQSR